MTLAELLKSQGASDDDIKLLDTLVARRAFDSQLKAVADATAAAAATDKAKRDYEASVEKWHNEQILPAYQKMEADKIKSDAELARAKAVILSAQDQGLLRVADDMGYKREPAAGSPAAAAAAPVDTSKFATQDSLRSLAETAGDGLAVLQDIVMEHQQLFPDRPLRVREIRREAVAANKTVEQYWMDKYGVGAARDKRDSDAKAAYEKRLRDEGAAEARQQLADRYGNPEVRPLTASISPLAPRAAGTSREKMPWESTNDSTLSLDRVKRATAAVINQQTQGPGRTN